MLGTYAHNRMGSHAGGRYWRHDTVAEFDFRTGRYRASGFEWLVTIRALGEVEFRSPQKAASRTPSAAAEQERCRHRSSAATVHQVLLKITSEK